MEFLTAREAREISRPIREREYHNQTKTIIVDIVDSIIEIANLGRFDFVYEFGTENPSIHTRVAAALQKNGYKVSIEPPVYNGVSTLRISWEE